MEVGVFLIPLMTVLLFSVFYSEILHSLYSVQPIPEFETTWWGPGKPKQESITVTPFQINVSQEILFDLKDRLNNRRPFAPPLEGALHEYGLNSRYFENIINHWKKSYNWTEREHNLNQLPQYTTQIQGLNIHFIHVQSDYINSTITRIPLLLLHDWPNTNLEFAKVIPFLNRTRENLSFSFEVIAPSLPGFGFSDGSIRPGLGVAQLGVLLNNLMERLGKSTYYVHGEGWGGVIAENMALLYPDRVLGVHSNWCMALRSSAYLKILLGSKMRWLADKDHYDKIYPLSKKFSQLIQESTYSHLQFIKPDTIGIGLGDSPVGLAAYLVDIYVSLLQYNSENKEINHDTILLKYSYDRLLDNIMIYWVTNSITSSMRIFAEYYQQFHLISNMNRHYIQTPFVCSRLQQEVMFQTVSILKERYANLVEITDMPLTTRFPALEEPYFLADEIWYAISKIRTNNETMEEDDGAEFYIDEN